MLTKDVEMPKDIYDRAVNDFECKWTNGAVKIKKLTFGDTKLISNASMKVKAYQVGGEMKPDISIDPMETQTHTILRGVITAPWAINDASEVNNLPPQVAEWVLNEIEEFNSVSVKKKEN